MNLLQGLDLGDGLLLVLAASRDTYHEIGPSTRARVVRRGLHAKATGRMPLAAAQDKPALPVAIDHILRTWGAAVLRPYMAR